MSENILIAKLKMKLVILKVAHPWVDFVEKLLMLMFSPEHINIWEFCCIIDYLCFEESLLTIVQTVRFSLQSKSQGSDYGLLLSRHTGLISFLSFLVIWLLTEVHPTELLFCEAIWRRSVKIQEHFAITVLIYRHTSIRSKWTHVWKL